MLLTLSEMLGCGAYMWCVPTGETYFLLVCCWCLECVTLLLLRITLCAICNEFCEAWRALSRCVWHVTDAAFVNTRFVCVAFCDHRHSRFGVLGGHELYNLLIALLLRCVFVAAPTFLFDYLV